MLAVVDRMRSLGAKAVRFEAQEAAGELKLSAVSDSVALKVSFRGLAVNSHAQEDGGGEYTSSHFAHSKMVL